MCGLLTKLAEWKLINRLIVGKIALFSSIISYHMNTLITTVLQFMNPLTPIVFWKGIPQIIIEVLEETEAKSGK